MKRKRGKTGRFEGEAETVLKSQKKRRRPAAKTPQPPVEHQFKPGQSGNPAGRPANVGLSLQEQLNLLGAADPTEEEIRKISGDPSAGVLRRGAALRLLRMIESPDLADFDRVLDGSLTLEQARELGISTSAIRKIKVRSGGEGIIEREIELHDRSGDDFDRVCDRTSGKPRQAVDVNNTGDITLRTADQGEAEADRLLSNLRSRFSIKRS